jgi:hypothetical protein
VEKKSDNNPIKPPTGITQKTITDATVENRCDNNAIATADDIVNVKQTSTSDPVVDADDADEKHEGTSDPIDVAGAIPRLSDCGTAEISVLRRPRRCPVSCSKVCNG